MVISGIEKELGAIFEAKRIEDDNLVYGISIIKVDANKSYLIQRFETNDSVDGSPGLAYYAAVKTSSIKLIQDNEDEENACQNCHKCKCFSCEYREGGHGGDCTGRCESCGDEPIDNCEDFKYADW